MRVGGHAFRYLTARSRSGRVISGFRHGLNVLFDDEADPALIPIQTSATPLHPFGIEVRRRPIAREGDQVFADSGCIQVGAGDRVELESAAIDELRVERYAQADAALVRARQPLLDQEPAERGKDPFESRIDGLLAGWRGTERPVNLADLVGLGTGSTPSGDDVLAGLLAGWTAVRDVEARADRALAARRKELRSMSLRDRTSLASAQMIEAALDGSFPEPLRDLCTALPDPRTRVADVEQLVARVAMLGGTSGRWMLRGLFSGLCSV